MTNKIKGKVMGACDTGILEWSRSNKRLQMSENNDVRRIVPHPWPSG